MSSDLPQPNSSDPLHSNKKSSKSRIWLRRTLELSIFIVIIFGVRAWQQRDVVKDVAPALSGITLDNKVYDLRSSDKPVLVHFWATWCPVCRAEQSTIESIGHSNQNIITIAMQSGKSSEVQQYMRDQKVSFPVINDADGRISALWGVSAVPASFIVDKDGQIRYVEIGYTTEIGLRLRLWLAGL